MNENGNKSALRIFKVNPYITLKLEGDKTNIYVNKKLYIHCKYILLNKKIGEIKDLNLINSVDELAEDMDHFDEKSYLNINFISPETRFWVHCSNLQIWSEQNYDTRLIHSNLGFPLLKRLKEEGDLVAKRVYKEEIMKRFKEGYLNTIITIIDGEYLDILTEEERSLLLLENNPKLLSILKDNTRNLNNSKLVKVSSILMFLHEFNNDKIAVILLRLNILNSFKLGHLESICYFIKKNFTQILTKEEKQIIFLKNNNLLLKNLTTESQNFNDWSENKALLILDFLIRVNSDPLSIILLKKRVLCFLRLKLLNSKNSRKIIQVIALNFQIFNEQEQNYILKEIGNSNDGIEYLENLAEMGVKNSKCIFEIRLLEIFEDITFIKKNIGYIHEILLEGYLKKIDKKKRIECLKSVKVLIKEECYSFPKTYKESKAICTLFDILCALENYDYFNHNELHQIFLKNFIQENNNNNVYFLEYLLEGGYLRYLNVDDFLYLLLESHSRLKRELLKILIKAEVPTEIFRNSMEKLYIINTKAAEDFFEEIILRVISNDPEEDIIDTIKKRLARSYM